jgi:hypothetical protein
MIAFLKNKFSALLSRICGKGNDQAYDKKGKQNCWHVYSPRIVAAIRRICKTAKRKKTYSALVMIAIFPPQLARLFQVILEHHHHQ